MPDLSQTKLNHKLTLRIIEMTLVTLVFSLFARPILAELHPYYFWIAIFDIIITSSLYLVVRSNKWPKWHISLSLISSLIIILPMLSISGGVNSQVAFFLPLYPIVGALIGGRLESRLMSLFLIVAVLFATIFNHSIINVSGEYYADNTSYLRGFWLILAIMFSAIFGQFFLNRYTELTKKLTAENLQDPLTELLNRRGLNLHFALELEQAKETKSPFCLMLIDIDYFKKINDQYGHDVGDTCLIEVADRLNKGIQSHHYLARFGGEEFIIVLPNTHLLEAEKIAEQLRQTIEDSHFSHLKLPITITLGIARLHGERDNALKIIKRADKALYRGKEKGRNRIELEN